MPVPIVHGERIPLTIADTDKEKGLITIVYLVLGKSTALLEALNPGDSILDVCGPLGRPTHIEKGGTVICVGGGTGIAAMHHIAKGHHLAGNKVVAIIGARSKDLLLFEKELSLFADELLISTDDGSYGHKGLVTELLKGKLDGDEPTRFACVDGPEFDGHKVDFAELRLRLGAFRAQEQQSMEAYRSTAVNG